MINVGGMVIGLVLLLGNAFFVGAEFALISARRTQIEPRATAGSRPARMTLRALEHVSLMMAGAQLGITMCSLGLGAVAEPAVAHAIEIPLSAAGVPDGLLHPIALVIALTIVVSLHMTIGEMVPKNIAIAGPERAALVLGPPLYLIVTMLRPFIALINWIANHLLRALKVSPRDEVASAFTADEVAGFIAESRQEGLLNESTHNLLAGALAISGDPVEAVMVPRADLVTVSSQSTVGDVLQQCLETGYSRFPVAVDDVVMGYVHVKDLLDHSADDRLPPEEIRTLIDVRAGTSLDEVLTAMQVRGTHVATVTSGDGQMIGAAMLEDVVERVVGEIADAAQLSLHKR